ncbi:ATP-dependent nuclease [Paenibacillus wulumuqiensis]|uniref:ATP-dependent nuclease n=1 Tax=Paenibacillus wulumuqiensis TaxID=1567107 RepID=UPI000619206F|nr:AAA family ATPase [Paenibacillus wulumuqiensis]
MHIEKVIIENFKIYEGRFEINFNNGLNILVGDNEAGKSTILEAIHLALTGLLNGRNLRSELTEYLFNNRVVKKYIDSLKDETKQSLPYILIEIYIAGDDCPKFEGDSNLTKTGACGISFRIAFDDKYQIEYEELVKNSDVKTLPIEYYDIFLETFARENITHRRLPLKSALIDSSSNRYQNGSDIYISRIVRDHLEPTDIVNISQAHRKMRESFMNSSSIKLINQKIQNNEVLSGKKVELSVELLSKNAWENSLMTYLNKIPFHFLGKGEQCIVKTELALSHKKSQEANIILVEEPENHLSHTKLNQFINRIQNRQKDKQIIISTHSSFVANKLGLDKLILLNDKKTLRLEELKDSTTNFFEKISGYDTLRLILCRMAILVEGDSDELIVQKAYMSSNNGKLPIEDQIDVISVGTSFLRFLEIASALKKEVVVVTDNDGDVKSLEEKYSEYINENKKENIKICYDAEIDSGSLLIGGKNFNYNTLEPKLLKVNNLKILNRIYNTKCKNEDDMHKHMRTNKTDCALKVFDSEEAIKFPNYILEAISTIQ